MSDKSAKRLPIRFLTLAEIVGVVALVIAGLGYWDTHKENIQAEKDRAAAARERDTELAVAARKPAFLMTGLPDGDKVRLTSVHADQVIQTQTLWFPTTLRADAAQTTGNPRIEAGWFEDGLHKAIAGDKAKTGRVPVVIVTTFIEDGDTKIDTALYQLGYSLHARMLRSDRVDLDGLSLARRGVSGNPQAAADTLWAAR